MHIILDLILLLIGATIVITCYKRGFFKSVIRFFKTILAFLAAYFLGGSVAGWLCDKWIGTAVRERVYLKVHEIYQSTADSFGADHVTSAVPDFLMSEKLKAQLSMAEGSGEELVSSMTDIIATPIATVISNALGYLGVFLLALLALWLVAMLLDGLIDKLPLIGTLNHVLGLILGLLIASTVLLVVASILELIFAQSTIYTNSILTRFFGELPLPRPFRFLDVGGTWLAQIIG